MLLLSGTPALARPVELYPQVASLRGGLFGSYTQFTKRYCDAHRGRFGFDVSGSSNLSELNRLLSTFMCRRLKRNVLTQLPRKIRSRVAVELPGGTQRTMRQLALELKEARRATDEAEGQAAWAAKGEANRKLMEAYQATGMAKLDGVSAYVKDLLEGTASEEKILVFAHHKAVLDGLQATCSRAKVRMSSS